MPYVSHKKKGADYLEVQNGTISMQGVWRGESIYGILLRQPLSLKLSLPFSQMSRSSRISCAVPYVDDPLTEIGLFRANIYFFLLFSQFVEHSIQLAHNVSDISSFLLTSIR